MYLTLIIYDVLDVFTQEQECWHESTEKYPYWDRIFLCVLCVMCNVSFINNNNINGKTA